MNQTERRERAEIRADVLALIGFVLCVGVGAVIGMFAAGPPGLVVGAVITAPFSLLVAAFVNRMPFMKDVY